MTASEEFLRYSFIDFPSGNNIYSNVNILTKPVLSQHVSSKRVDGEHFELPTCMLALLDCKRNIESIPHFPLYVCDTFSGTISKSLSFISKRCGFSRLNNPVLPIFRCDVSDDEYFFVSRGLIIDKYGKVLFLLTCTLEVCVGDWRGAQQYIYSDSSKLNCYINPSVLSGDDSLSKFIIKKIIPSLLDLRYVRNNFEHQLKIIIDIDEDNINNFIYKVTMPKSSFLLNERINNFLNASL